MAEKQQHTPSRLPAGNNWCAAVGMPPCLPRLLRCCSASHLHCSDARPGCPLAAAAVLPPCCCCCCCFTGASCCCRSCWHCWKRWRAAPAPERETERDTHAEQGQARLTLLTADQIRARQIPQRRLRACTEHTMQLPVCTVTARSAVLTCIAGSNGPQAQLQQK